MPNATNNATATNATNATATATATRIDRSATWDQAVGILTATKQSGEFADWIIGRADLLTAEHTLFALVGLAQAKLLADADLSAIFKARDAGIANAAKAAKAVKAAPCPVSAGEFMRTAHPLVLTMANGKELTLAPIVCTVGDGKDLKGAADNTTPDGGKFGYHVSDTLIVDVNGKACAVKVNLLALIDGSGDAPRYLPQHDDDKAALAKYCEPKVARTVAARAAETERLAKRDAKAAQATATAS